MFDAQTDTCDRDKRASRDGQHDRDKVGADKAEIAYDAGSGGHKKETEEP